MKNKRKKTLITRLASLALCLGLVVALPSLTHAKGGDNAMKKPNPAVAPHRAGGLNSTVYNQGRIARDLKGENSYRRAHPCPSTGKVIGPCPGYYIFYAKPKKKGGAVIMQWRKNN